MICGKASTKPGYCDFHFQKSVESGKKRYTKFKEDGKRLIEQYIEETNMARNKYVIREDKQGRCYVSLVIRYEGGEYYEDVVMVYKTKGMGFIEGWEDTAKKICDMMNQEEPVLE
jgi:hypothetical protein